MVSDNVIQFNYVNNVCCKIALNQYKLDFTGHAEQNGNQRETISHKNEWELFLGSNYAFFVHNIIKINHTKLWITELEHIAVLELELSDYPFFKDLFAQP